MHAAKRFCLEHCTKPFLQLLISITATVEYVCLISFPITLPIHIKSCSCYKNKIHCTNIAKNALKVYRFRSKNYQLSYKRQENEKKKPPSTMILNLMHSWCRPLLFFFLGATIYYISLCLKNGARARVKKDGASRRLR